MRVHWEDMAYIRTKKKVNTHLHNLITEKLATGKYNSITLACIGTDRSTGDSLGPFVGENLKNLKLKNVNVIGNLKFPLHAKNLEERLSEVEENSLVIGIDACLGDMNNIGKIYIEEKPVKPGAAMDKDLPPVGDISIIGIVNVSGTLEFMVLQNTRLYTVYSMANEISNIIKDVLLDIDIEATA